jgi:hypothetical protein
LVEKEEAAEKVRDRIELEELEQTLFDLRGEIGARRHVPPGVCVLSLRTNPAQEWEDLRQAALDSERAQGGERSATIASRDAQSRQGAPTQRPFLHRGHLNH